MSSLFAMSLAVVSKVPNEDHREKKGCFVNLTNDLATLCIADTDLPFGLILDGENTDGRSSLAIPGGNVGPCFVKAGGVCTEGSFGQLVYGKGAKNDAGSGNRTIVCRFLESGVEDDLVKAVLLNPEART